MIAPEVDVWVGSSYGLTERKLMLLGVSWWGETEPLLGMRLTNVLLLPLMYEWLAGYRERRGGRGVA